MPGFEVIPYDDLGALQAKLEAGGWGMAGLGWVAGGPWGVAGGPRPAPYDEHGGAADDA